MLQCDAVRNLQLDARAANSGKLADPILHTSRESPLFKNLSCGVFRAHIFGIILDSVWTLYSTTFMQWIINAA
jgi:hypothetical protein